MADLRRLRTLTFVARSQKATGWNGQGHGQVAVDVPSPDALVFHETGQWQPSGREHLPSLQFSNTYRWTLVDEKTVRLEHLRLGPAQPVFLVDLQPAPGRSWASVTPHECVADLYALSLSVEADGITVEWKITGPKKNEHITYRYGFGA